jgi:5-methylcytosine-specific restriction enzyme subunit McrC
LGSARARHGGVREARLPCLHFERRVDWHLNQVLRAGLDAAAGLSEDRDLRRRLRRLAGMFTSVERKARLDASDIDRAERGLTRLTASNGPALTIIRLLHNMRGLAFESAGQPIRLPGFLFNMNVFFQRLVSRFLHENLRGQRIVDEWAIRNLFAYAPDANPRQRTAPQPRPDYALFDGNTLRAFLDAKYRDTWERGVPADWLYQLSIYALASPARVSVLLYASMAAEARDEQVDVRQPITWASQRPASVILRAVRLAQLAELVDPARASSLARIMRER